jgi:hypothetical protein
MMFEDARSTPAIFFRKKHPNKPPMLSTTSSAPGDRADRQHQSLGLTYGDDRLGSMADIHFPGITAGIEMSDSSH